MGKLNYSTFSKANTSFDFQNFKTSDKKKVWIEAFGCSANIADAEIIKGILYKNGYDLSCNRKDSDLTIIVTCA
ncbi:MAG TPA: hypothetical protein VJM74_01985, partial [Nitrososphaeraceae archaeon]|nr:hypothetical protein [Nitrososphaeraceae archaeon]